MFDAILLVAYGAPEKLEDVEPFLKSIARGAAIPQERLDAVYARYARFNGVSPLPAEARKALALLRDDAAELAPSPRVYLGNLRGEPSVDDALATAARENARNLLVLPCSAFGSAISCLRYRAFVENAWRRLASESNAATTITFAPPFYDLPEFQRALADSVLEALAWNELDDGLFENDAPNERLLLFTAHSIPTASATRSQYARQLLAAADAVARAIFAAPAFGESNAELPPRPAAPFASPAPLADAFAPETLEAARRANLRLGFAFQSRSGSPATPWLEPDVLAFVREQAAASPRLKGVVAVPIGFFFENMETIYDLDVELKETCDALSLSYRRARCVGATERVARGVARLARLEVGDFPPCRAKENACDFSCRARLN